MVTNTSPTTMHATENEKKRKQGLDRAKANHLSRQLQMRLQYAKLKVDHGWQKQSLNEVENLYFHHSHLRGPRGLPSSAVLATTQRDPMAFTPPTTQPSLVFKLGSSSSSRSATNEVEDSTIDPPNPLTAHASTRSNIDPSLLPPEALLMIDVDRDDLKLQNDYHPSNSHHPPSSATNNSYPTHSSNTPNISSSGSAPPPASPQHNWVTNTTSPPSSMPTHHLQPNSNTTPSADAFGFNPSSLTYDSFWSSHTAAGRSQRNSTSGIPIDFSSSGVGEMPMPISMSNTQPSGGTGASPGRKTIRRRAAKGKAGAP